MAESKWQTNDTSSSLPTSPLSPPTTHPRRPPRHLLLALSSQPLKILLSRPPSRPNTVHPSSTQKPTCPLSVLPLIPARSSEGGDEPPTAKGVLRAQRRSFLEHQLHSPPPPPIPPHASGDVPTAPCSQMAIEQRHPTAPHGLTPTESPARELRLEQRPTAHTNRPLH